MPAHPGDCADAVGTIDSAIAAGRIGARDYITKPFRIEELRVRLDRSVQVVDLPEENRQLREQLHTQVAFRQLQRLVGKDAARLPHD